MRKIAFKKEKIDCIDWAEGSPHKKKKTVSVFMEGHLWELDSEYWFEFQRIKREVMEGLTSEAMRNTEARCQQILMDVSNDQCSSSN